MSAQSDTQNVKCGVEIGGARLFVKSGGELDIESGGALKIAGVAVTASAAEINAMSGGGLSAAELGVLDGVTAGTVAASKAVVVNADRHVDTIRTAELKIGATGAEVDKTNVIIGAAGGYKVARGSAAALDGSNPTPIATGLATIVAASVQLRGTAAPGDNTSVLTTDYTGSDGTLNVYAWKNTGGTDPTLVASTGTETFDWIAIGT